MDNKSSENILETNLNICGNQAHLAYGQLFPAART
jgi:hypothetical protein